mmetsp:Transcript_8755/g.14853  ORF Transcript_8755/g.14853 Transcript_8755/m.14853 type:complete len:126 (+) Transcript_8755:533-910(+)
MNLQAWNLRKSYNESYKTIHSETQYHLESGVLNAVDNVDLAEIDEINLKFEAVDKFIAEHEYELNNLFSKRDWMNICSKLTHNCDIDMDFFIPNCLSEIEYKYYFEARKSFLEQATPTLLGEQYT